MENWRKSLEVFLENWNYKDELAGVLICGSYITGNPSERSDIDVHLVLKESEGWRERGNQVVNGYLIEYFCNPPAQIRNYLAEDYHDRGTHAAVQFATGEILFDKEGTIAALKKEAAEWLAKPFEPVSETALEFKKYAIWDTLDNLQDSYEQNRSDFRFVYHNSLKVLFDYYCDYLSIETIPYYQIGAYLGEESFLAKYLKAPFPDETFSKMYLEALKAPEEETMTDRFEELCNHVLAKMGGFSIDGWKMRSPIEK